MSGCPSKETTKEVSDQTWFDNFKHCKSYLLEIGRMYTRETGCCISKKFVMSGLVFLKLVTMIEHIKMMQITYLDEWSMLPSTSASYKVFKSLI